jgi:hypothetical protein
LRRTTPAMTTAILGAVLMASTVRAQRSNPSADGPLGQSDTTAGPDSAHKPADDLIYGLSVTRGARYLLRNGLDYLNYKEYERALKFLREVETRKDELNDAEKLILKKGIETAKRGMRQAAGAESPYALSDSARNRNGFSPAKPESSIASLSERPQAAPRKLVAKQAKRTSSFATNDADDRGEPILLASGDAAPSNSSSGSQVAARSTQVDSALSVVNRDADRPRQFPDIPKLPKTAQRLDETDRGQNVLEKSASQLVDHTPALELDQPEVVRVSGQGAPTIQVPAPLSDSVSPMTSAPGTREFTQTGTVDLAPKEIPNPSAIELETKPVSPAATENEQSGELAVLAHKESEEPGDTPTVAQLVVSSPARDVSSPSTPVATNHAEDQAPVPTDLRSNANVARPPTQTSLPKTIPSTIQTRLQTGADELPPLPSDVSNSAEQPRSAGNTAPVTTSESTSPTEGSNNVDDLPTLPGDLSSHESRSNGTRVVPLTPDSANARAVTSSIAVQNSVVRPAGVGSEVSPGNPVGPTENEVALPPVPTYVEEITDTNSPAAAPPLSTQTLPANEPSAVEIPGSRLTDAKALDVPSQPTVRSPNTELAQVSPATASPVVMDSPNASSLPPAIENSPAPSSRSDFLIPGRSTPPSTLRPELKREVEIIVRKQEDDLRRRQQVQAQPVPPARDTIVSDLRAQTQLDISRAPSPAEARPIKAIPVPEDWVPLPPRTWVAQRKYWAAAATCHLPLYFQDPVLERYGHSVEQFVGPIGRYFTYPLDDPTQSTQRNQILQPFFSIGLFAFQIAALPYNVLMDPPWEAQYDLGYYRPGDNIPTDTYWLPLHGYGPPLRGSNY